MKHSDDVPVLKIMETQRPKRVSETVEEQVDVPAPGEGIQEHTVEEVVEVSVTRVMEESVEVARLIPQESIQQRSVQEVVPGATTDRRGIVSGETEDTVGWSSLQREKVQCDTSSTQGESAKVTGARLVSARHARKRQRKIASKSCVRFGDEEQSVVGTLESPVADLECPLRSGPVWRWKDNDSGENVSEWTVDDVGEKITDEVDETKCFKQVRAWDGVHMCQSSQERPGGQHRGPGHASKAWKQVWMQFEGKSRPWDIQCGESGDEMGKRWREMNGMGELGMHMVSGGRVMSWNDIKNLEDGAIVQVMENVQGGLGKRRKKKKKERNPWQSDGGSETKSSAEEPFEVIDKAALMAEHRKELGNKYIDMMGEHGRERH